MSIRILSVDLGQVRTGLAVCDEGEVLASPLAVIAGSGKKLIHQVKIHAAEVNAGLVVVGNPLNMDGSGGESAERASEFAGSLEKVSGLPVRLWDERLTTVSAHRALNQTNTRGSSRKAVIDAVAAVMILEDYLRFRKNNRR